MNFEIYFEKLFNFYNVSTIKELSEKIKIGASTISAWNQRKSITALKKACRELGIYNEIFKENEQEKEMRIQEDILHSICNIFELAEKKDLIRALKNDLAKMYTKYFLYDKDSKDEYGKNIFPNEIVFIGEEDEETELKRLKKENS